MAALQIAVSPGLRAPPSDWHPWLEGLAESVAAVHPLAAPIQLIVADDAYLRQLNAAYRDRDEATDVLSFDLGAPDLPEVEAVAAEIYISLERAAAQAAEQAVPVMEEMARLLVHGLLHLAGFEHDTPASLRRMEEETEVFLRTAEFPLARETDDCTDPVPGSMR